MTTITKTKNLTKTISLRLPLDLAEFLETASKQEGRSVSNYIKWLVQSQKQVKTESKIEPKTRKKIQDMNDKEFQQHLEKTRKIGDKVFRSFGLDPEKMTEEDAYNFFKNI